MNRWIPAATLALSLVSTPAFALTPETTTLVSDTTLSVPSTFDVDDTTAYVGIAECERMIANNSLVGATFGTAFDTTLQADLFDRATFFDVARDSSARIDCDSDELCREIDEEDVMQTNEVIEVEVDFVELTQFATEADCADTDREYFIRVQLREVTEDDNLEFADVRVVVDTIRPVAPTVTDVTVTESQIRVEFEPSSSADLKRYRIVYSTEPLTEGALPDELSASGATFGSDSVSAGDIDVELEPGSTVYVAVAAQDETGNLSPLSGVTQATALETTDFWEAYKGAGGAEEGGCSHTPGSPAPNHFFWLAALGAAVLIRKGMKR